MQLEQERLASRAIPAKFATRPIQCLVCHKLKTVKKIMQAVSRTTTSSFDDIEEIAVREKGCKTSKSRTIERVAKTPT
jgi:hypothetical protein